MEIVGIVLGGVLGAGLGYLLRVREWMREKRLAGYVEFIASFFDVMRRALIAFRSQSDEAYKSFDRAWDRFAASRAQVAVLAGSKQTNQPLSA